VHWFARLEKGNPSLRHGNLGPAPWISAWPTSSHPHSKRSNAPQLNTLAPCQRRDNLFKYGVDGPLSIAPAQMWISNSNAINQLRFYHWYPLADQRVAGGAWARQARPVAGVLSHGVVRGGNTPADDVDSAPAYWCNCN
jgi:hypothetical protein